jgi:dTDP-3-amino-3,4,6-trideoxy-alpha-D-glucose transaminase
LQRLEPAAREAVARVAQSGRVLLGPETEAFEDEFATYVGKRSCVAVASGTEALRLSLVALGVGPGDEVVVPAFTAVPTAAAVCAAGAAPVFADVDAETGALDHDAAAAAVTDRTRAVIVVHLYGRPAPLPDLGVAVLSDASHAHGALTAAKGHDRAATMTAYSFYPTKNLGGFGDGGAVVTDDDALAARVRLLRTHGLTHDYIHEAIATNARMSEFEAGFLRAALEQLDGDNARRRAIAARVRDAAPQLRWQPSHPDHVFHLLVARVAARGSFRASLPFETGLHYPVALTQQPAYQQFVRAPCPNAEAWAAECVSMPCFPELTDAELDVVANALAGCPA